MKLVTSGGQVSMMLALLLTISMSSANQYSVDHEKKAVDLEAKRAENLKRFDRLDNRRYIASPPQARRRVGKSYGRTPSIESDGTPDAPPMSLEKAVQGIACIPKPLFISPESIVGSETASPIISEASISPGRSDTTPPTYATIFDFELEVKAAADLNLCLQSRSSDTEDGSPQPPHPPKTTSMPKKKGDSQAMSLPIDIPIRDKPSMAIEKATQSQSTGSDIYLDRARLSRELERVRARIDNKFQSK